MAINTNKNILITPGAFSALSTAVSQIDLKWYESGVGTFVFTRSANDLRSTIYNWVDLNEPVLQFGGMGTVGNQQYFVGPYSDYVGGFNGISSLPSVKIYPISGQLITNTLKVNGKLYDYNNSYGLAQQILSSSSSGIAWTNPSSVGILTGSGTTNYVARFISPTSIGTSYITDDGSTININLPINNIVALTDATINTITVGLGSAFYPTNLALGYKALFNNTSSLNAIAIGYQALLNSTNSSNSIALGVNAGQFSNSSNSIAVGNFSLRGSSSTYFTGSNTVAIGHQAGQNIGSASNSVIIGSGAQIAPDGSYQIAIGYGVAPTASNLGSWGGNTNSTKTDLGIGTYTPLSRLHIETLAPGNKGLYIAGVASQTANLLQIDATTSGVNYVVVTGVGSVGVGTAFPTQILHIQGNTRITGGLYDSSNNIGLAGSVISSTGNGIAWTSTFLGTILANQVAFGASTKYITGSNNLWFTGTNLGIGTSNAPYTLTVQGDTYVSGITTSGFFSGDGSSLTNLNASNLVTGTVPSSRISGAYSGITSVGTLSQLNVSGVVTSNGFFGPGTNITNLNASNLITGTVPSSRISGTYSGITSVGTLSQLSVSGFSTVYSLWLNAQVYDINNSPGSLGNILTSTGTGVAWSTPSQVGIITGSASVNQIAYWNASNQITGSGNFVINGLGSVGIGTSIPTSAITVRGDALINGATVGLGGGGNNSSNTTVGVQALSINTTSTINNVSIGYQANQNATSANSNVMVGYQAGRYFNGGQSISMGYQALYGSSTTSITQTAIVAVGYQAAQFANATNIVAIGYKALQGTAVTTTNSLTDNTVVGYGAGQYLSSSSNAVVGLQALQGSATTPLSASSNVAIGKYAARFTGALYNISIGREAMQGADGQSTGGNNIAIGYQALTNITTASNSVAIGHQAATYTTFGANNTVIGYQARLGTATTPLNSSNITAIGYQAAKYHSGSNSVFVGFNAGLSSSIVLGTGNYNVAVGYAALNTPTTAANNVAVGFQAGSSITSGTNNTIIGYNADADSSSQYQIALGGSVVPTGSNLGAWGGATNATRTDLGLGTFTPLSRLHIQTLSSGNGGIYIAGAASQTANLLQIDATTSGANYVTVGSAGSVGIGTATPTQSLHIQNSMRVSGRLFDNNNSSGTTGQVLAVTASGIAWTSAGSGTVSGSASANQIAYFTSASVVAGVSTFVYSGGNIGIGTATPTQMLHIQGNTRHVGAIYDSNNSSGGAGQVLASTVTGVAWTNAGSGGGGTITGSVALNQVAFGIATNSIQGSNNLWFNGSSLGVGTSSVTQALTVQGNATVSGITTSGTFSGSGLLITSLNASNLTSGTVSSSVVSGAYSGITSVGTLSQLNVSGFSTVYSLWLDAQVYDINNSPGSSGSLLTSIESGVAWSSVPSLGIITGVASANQISYWNNANQITGISTFVFVNGNIGIGTAIPQQTLHTIGTARIDGSLILNSNSTDTKTQRIFAGASSSTISTSFITVASISVPTGYQLSIEGKANGWFSTTLNEAGTFFGVYFNVIGIASAVGSVDIMSKYTGSSGNFSLNVSGTNVQIQVKADLSSNLWLWKTQYDYLITQNT